jgi:adenylate cyclase
VKLLPNERKAIEQAPTRNVEAYTYYLRGREFFHRGSKSNYMLAKLMFAKAIELDPHYARAFAGMADCDAFLYMDYSEDGVADVLRNSAKALALDASLVEALASHALGLSVAHRYDEADREFAQAMALAPDSFEVHFFHGRSTYAQGKLEQTARLWERAAEIKPDDFQSLILLNQVYTSLGWQHEARSAAQRGVERAERAFAVNPEDPRPAYFIATGLAKLGDVARADDWAEKALAVAPDDYLTQYNLVCFYSVSGRFDRAFEMLFAILPRSNAEMMNWILTDSDLDPMHADPRWQEIERRAKPVAEGAGSIIVSGSHSL